MIKDDRKLGTFRPNRKYAIGTSKEQDCFQLHRTLLQNVTIKKYGIILFCWYCSYGTVLSVVKISLEPDMSSDSLSIFCLECDQTKLTPNSKSYSKSDVGIK